MIRQEVAVVIPIHKTTLNEYEKISLEQCLRVLYRYPIILNIPDNIPLGDFEKYKNRIIINKIDSRHFKDSNAYNRLLISKKFYRQFLGYEYILIYQLDVFVFKDELSNWCAKKYDYIGSPWLDKPDWINTLKPLWAWRDNLVGNGGLSLRKVPTFINMLNWFAMFRFVFEWHARNAEIHEDVFWSLYIPSLNPFFKVPDSNTALKFSFEKFPSKAYELNNHELPFGCHAWEKYELDFWRKFLKEHGYFI